jgi:hypothetical protein
VAIIASARRDVVLITFTILSLGSTVDLRCELCITETTTNAPKLQQKWLIFRPVFRTHWKNFCLTGQIDLRNHFAEFVLAMTFMS